MTYNPLVFEDLPNPQLVAEFAKIQAAIGAGAGRTVLTADTAFYVDPTGNNTTGTGSIGNPWATPQQANDYIADSLDIAGKTITINVADGSYSGVNWREFVGGGNIVWLGNNTTPANVVIGNGSVGGSFASFGANIGTVIWVSGFKMTPTAGPCIDVDGSTRGVVILGEPTFALPSKNIFAGCQANSSVLIGNIFDETTDISTIDGTAINAHTPSCFWSIINPVAQTPSFYLPDYNVTGAVTFSRAVFWAAAGTSLNISGAFGGAGNVTGPKYAIDQGAFAYIDDLANFPGTTAGKLQYGYVIVGFPNVTNTFTVAQLPLATSGAGTRVFVTDSLGNATFAYGNAVVGSGSNKVPVYSDGTYWIVG